MQISAEAERRLAMRAKLVGVQGIHFTNNSGEEVNGTKIYCAFQDENVEGLRTADFFLKDGITLPKDTKLNDAIDISFNMKGKVEMIFKAYLLIERGVRHEKGSSHLGKIKSDIRRSVCIFWNRNKQIKRYDK